MEAIGFSEILIPAYQNTPCHIPEDHYLLNSNLILQMQTNGTGMIQGKPMLGKPFAQGSPKIVPC